MEIQKQQTQPIHIIIGIVSIAVPLLVAYLFFTVETKVTTFDASFLPHLNATINGTVAVLLIIGFVMIKQKKVQLHRTMMMSAFVLSAIFLISYVIYHTSVPSTKFGGEGTIRYVYFFFLLTHIICSVLIVPLVLFSIYFAFSKQIERHKRLVKWTFPIWTYVAVTGVIVYILISPYYS